jgi:glycosyltransferase involved in cell wall biosynthesis
VIPENAYSSFFLAAIQMHEISVAVPTFNSEKYLESTLFCLVHQIGCNVEVIVADSGSVDETLNICKKYSIKTIFVPPGSMYPAINNALALCESPWLCYLNSDDLVYPTSYARLIHCGESQKADIVYGSCDYIDREGRYLHSYSPGKPRELKSHFLASQMSFAQPSAIFRQNVFRQLNGFSEQYRHISDFDFYLRSIMAGFKFAMLEGNPVCSFRVSSSQISQSIGQVKMELNQIRRDYPKPSMKDLWVTSSWKIRNLPNYLIRFLRHRVMAGKYKYVRTTDVWPDGLDRIN